MSPSLAPLTWLLVFQRLRETVSRVAGSRVPRPVVGFALLFITVFGRPVGAERASPVDRPADAFAGPAFGAQGPLHAIVLPLLPVAAPR